MIRILALVLFVALSVAFVLQRSRAGESSPFDPTRDPDPPPSVAPSEAAAAAPAPPRPEIRARSLSTGLPEQGQWRGKPALADLDGDGKLDLVASLRRLDRETPGEGLHVWLGDGSGGWTLSIPGLHRDLGYGGAEVADIDGDGRLDLAFSAHVPKPRVYINFLDEEPPSWVATTENGIGEQAICGDVALGDFDRDGHVDLAAIAQFSKNGGLVLYSGEGTGEFTRTTELLPDLYFGAQVCMRDVDGDGHVELLAVATEGPRVWRFDPEAGVTDQSAGLPRTEFGGIDLAIDVADLDGDGHGELLLAGLKMDGYPGMRVFRWDGSAWADWGRGLPNEAFFDAEFFSPGPGLPPAIAAGGDAGISIVTMKAPGEFERIGVVAQTQGMLNLTAGDVTGDGRDEIVYVGFHGVRVMDVGLDQRLAMAAVPPQASRNN